MSIASEQNLWRRMRFTPIRDALRGRLTGRLDVDRLIAEAGLPAAPAQRVREVVRHTRLWRCEKVDVANELIAHFRDGLDDEVPVDELVAGFGDPKQAARLIRRAKKRTRPWPWHVARAMSLAVCVLVGVYVLAGLLLLMGRPAVTTDYVAELNAPARAVPDEDRAWPIYREALLTGLRDLEMDAVLVQGDHGKRPIRAGEPGWAEASAFLQAHEDKLALIREAAAKPGLGLTIGHDWDFTGLDREALWGPDAKSLNSPGDERFHDQLAEGSLIGVLLPQLGYFRNMARLLTVDTEQAWEQADHDRVLANLAAMLGLASHCRETPILINSFVAVSIVAMAQAQVADLLHRDPSRWSRSDLAKLAHLLAGVDPLVQMAYGGEQMMMYDTFQRFYSERGYVTSEGLRFLNQMRPLIDDMQAPDHVARVSIVGLPVANAMIASRPEMERKYDQLMLLLEAEADMPPWERMHRSPMDDAVQELAADQFSRIRYWPLVWILPSTSAAVRETDLSLALRDALHVVIAMELHRRDHDDYPADLAALSPHYLPTPPVDYSTGGPLRVRYIDEGGFVLYGLGRNGEDNGGTLSDDGRRRWPKMADTGDWVLYPSEHTEH